MLTGSVRPGRFGSATRLALAGVATVVALSGCGIDAEQTARQIADPPSDLINPTTTTTESQRPRFDLTLYFVNAANQLVEMVRVVDDRPTAQSAIEALGSLTAAEIARAEADENATGVSSKLGSFVYSAQPVENGVLTIGVAGVENESFRETIESSRVTQIYQQIVCTVTGLSGGEIVAVVISDDQGQIPVLVSGSPTAVTEPVGAALFDDCEPVAEVVPPTSTTSTTARPLIRPTTSTTIPSGSEEPETIEPAGSTIPAPD